MPKTSVKEISNLEQILFKMDSQGSKLSSGHISSARKSKRLDSPDYIFSPPSRDSHVDNKVEMKNQLQGKQMARSYQNVRLNKTQNFKKMATLYKNEKSEVKLYKPLDLGNERRYWFKRQN